MSGYVPSYRMLLDGLGVSALDGTAETVSVNAKFLDRLVCEYAGRLPFDAEFYRTSYPDVVREVARGGIDGLHTHFIAAGYREGRLPHAMPFDAAFYLAANPELAAIPAGDLYRHYQEAGYFDGLQAHPDTAAETARWSTALIDTPGRLTGRSFDGARVQAFCFPLISVEPEGFRGGPVLGSGPVDRLLRHRRHSRAIDSFPLSEHPYSPLAGDYVYGGVCHFHFGHVMSEVVHRVLPARAAFACRRLLFVDVHDGRPPSGFASLPPVMQAPLLFLGVDPEDVTVIHDNRVVERLHVAQQGSELPNGPSAPYVRMLADFTPARLDQLYDGGLAAPKLYVSRSRLREGGLLLGERHLERLLEAEGWHVLHPQEHTLVDQMQAYHRAEIVMFAGGSACHGTELFGTGGMKRCVLLPRGGSPNAFFEAVLRPRAEQFDILPDARWMGSLAIDERVNQVLDHHGVSVLDLPALGEAMRGLGLARLPTPDLPGYRARAMEDLAAYIAYHRERLGDRFPGWNALAADVEARCLAALG